MAFGRVRTPFLHLFEFRLKTILSQAANMWATLTPMCPVGYQGEIILYFGSKKKCFFGANLTCGTNMIYSSQVSKIQ
jgi:hypothetical protein